MSIDDQIKDLQWVKRTAGSVQAMPLGRRSRVAELLIAELESLVVNGSPADFVPEKPAATSLLEGAEADDGD